MVFGSHLFRFGCPKASENDRKIESKWSKNRIRTHLSEMNVKSCRFVYFSADFCKRRSASNIANTISKRDFAMCKVQRKLFNKSLQNPLSIDPKSMQNRSRKPSKTTLQKTRQKKIRNFKKIPKIVSQRDPGEQPTFVFLVSFSVLGGPGRSSGPKAVPKRPKSRPQEPPGIHFG